MFGIKAKIGKEETMELNRSDLLKFLGVLEGELQAREVVIAVLKSEQVKRLLYPHRRHVAEHVFESTGTATMIPAKTGRLCNSTHSSCNQEKEDSISDPYSALFRDACAAVDPTFDETSTKAVFHSQTKQLDLLLDKHKKAIHFLKCKLQEVNDKYNVVHEELQVERQKNIDFERDKVLKQMEELGNDKQKLQKEFDSMKAQFEIEREREKKMVICLLAERKQLIVRLIEEKQKNSELLQLYNTEKNRISEMVEGLEEESKRSLQMELDLERLTGEYEAQKEVLKEKLISSEARNVSLAVEVEKLRSELESKCKGASVVKDIGEGVRSAIVTMNSTITGHRVTPSVSSVATVNPPKLNVARPVSPNRPVTCSTVVGNSQNAPNPTVIKAVPGKAGNTPVNTSAVYATVQPCAKQPFTQFTFSSESTASEPPSKAATSKVITNPTVSSFQNLTYSIESAIPPLPTSNPPAVPPVAKVSPVAAVKNVQQQNTSPAAAKKVSSSSPVGANSTTRGVPPPIPPNKPVLPAHALKERSKELQAGVARAKLGSSTISGPVSGVSKLITVTQPVVIAGVSGPESKTGEILSLSPKKISETLHNGSKVDEESSETLSSNNNVDMLCQELADFQQLLVSMVTSKNN